MEFKFSSICFAIASKFMQKPYKISGFKFGYFYLKFYATNKVKFDKQKTIKILSLERFLVIG